MKTIMQLFCSCSALLMLTFLGGVRAEAAVLVVDDNPGNNGSVSCPAGRFKTIQAAVDAAAAGDVIRVCPGTYAEQVLIQSKTNLRIRGDNRVLVQPGPVVTNTSDTFDGSSVAAIVLVENSTSIVIENITVDGTGNGISSCATDLVGIYYRKATGQLLNNAVRNIKLGDGFENCRVGVGIYAQSGSNADPGGISTNLEVRGTSVHDYQRSGIVAYEVGTTLRAFGNFISGDGPNEAVAQFGVQVAFGTLGTIENNVILNHVYAPCSAEGDPDCAGGSAAAAGVIVFETGTPGNGVRVVNNVIGRNQYGIQFISTFGGVILSNRISDTDVYDAIYVLGNNHNIQSNTILNTDRNAIFVSGNNNTVRRNTINEAQVGVFNASPSGGNTVNSNTIFNTPEPLRTSSQNTATRTSSERFLRSER